MEGLMNLKQVGAMLGEARYLWGFLYMHSDEAAFHRDEQWLLVANGIGIGDEELAAKMEISVATAGTWRLKLEDLAAIRTVVVSPGIRRFEVFNFATRRHWKN